MVEKACPSDCGHLAFLENFIQKLTGPNGMTGIRKEIRDRKKDFGGRKVMICPSKPVYGTWESTWKPFLTQFTLRAAHEAWAPAFGGVFDLMLSAHNFTLDTTPISEELFF